MSPWHGTRVLSGAALSGMLAGLVWGSPALRTALSYDAPADCPSQSTVKLRVAERLGYDPFLSQPQLTIVVRTTREPAGYAAHVQMNDAVRRLPPVSNCEETAENIALVVALAIDPLGTAKPPVPVQPEPAEPILEDTSNTRSSARWLFHVGSFAAAGTTPSWTPSFRLGASWVRSMGRVYGEFRADLPQTELLDQNVGIRSSLYAATSGACLQLQALLGCVEVLAGALRGVPEALLEPAPKTFPYVSAGIRSAVVFNVGAFEIRPTAQVHVNLLGATLRAGEVPVWATPSVVGALGVDFSFGASPESSVNGDRP